MSHRDSPNNRKNRIMSISDHLSMETPDFTPKAYAYIDERGHIIIEGDLVF